MIGGYREDPEQATRRREERRDQIVFVAVALAVYMGLDFFKDALVTSLGLTQSGYGWLKFFVVILAVVGSRLLQHRISERLQTPSN